MTLLLAFATLLTGAACCFGLSRAAPTRALGLLAALVAFGAGGLALLAPAPEGAPLTLLTLGEARFSLARGLAGSERAIAAALLGGGGVALLALAGAIAGPVRGFGGIFGWALLSLAGALLSLAAPPLSLLQPFAWSLTALAGYGALRAAGGASTEEGPPQGLAFGLGASVLLTATLLAAPEPGALPAGPVAATGLLAALALAGCPPLLAAQGEAVEGPAPLGALIFGLSAPAAGLGWLLRVIGTLPPLPASWAVALGLIGGLGALACGAGALGVRRLRPLLGWAAGAQAALVVIAAGLADPQLAPITGPTLLIAMMLATALAACGAVSFERIAGSDDYTQAAAAAPPRVAGVAWAAAAVAILGLPPLFGLWGRVILLQMALEQQPWVIAPLLAGATLLALALLAPLAGFWADERAARARAGWSDWLPALLALAPLLALFWDPYLAWHADWYPEIFFVSGTLGPSRTTRTVALGAGIVLVLVTVLVSRAPSARTIARDPDEEAVRLPPEAAGEALRPLAWLALPAPLLGALWAGLERTSEGLRFLMGIFEQRYYLLGVLAALITIMLLMAQ